MQTWAARVATGVAALVVAANVVMLERSDHSHQTADLPRGRPITFADQPAVLNRLGALAVANSVRANLKAAPLRASRCLDGLAATYAASAATGVAQPTISPGTCGQPQVRFGWATGADRTGIQMARAALGASPSGPSPLVDSVARSVGWALAPCRVGGQVTGYALAWVVSP
ncbi:MAG: hypothetical protein QOE89_3442 [Pseudonocardiales bacterium]|nr:hypothetical protein [Pseudonocardiales bacterium]